MMKKVGFIKCSLEDINISTVLRCGQAFRWTHLEDEERWLGPLGGHLWALKQDRDGITCHALGGGEKADVAVVEDYFQLKEDLPTLYRQWSRLDARFAEAAGRHVGIRVLRQDPVETLFAFICSSNNHILRITSMLEKMCRRFGHPIGDYNGHQSFSFPELKDLAAPGVEAELRQLGFGYRAEFVSRAATQVQEKGGEVWLHELRRRPYAECSSELRKLHGVGAKVADCVCLMALDKPEAVPVDTHVLQVARKYYLPDLPANKTLTDRSYRLVTQHFGSLFGPRAGWAQAVLFCDALANQPKTVAKHPREGTSEYTQQRSSKRIINVADNKPRKKT